VGLRAVSFDLFDTLVDLHMETLPEFEVAGRKLRGSQPLLYDAIRAHTALDFAGFVRALAAVDRELRDTRHAQGLEIPTPERFRALCTRLEIADGELPERLTEIHMGCIRGQVKALDHHPAVLAALRGGLRLAVCSNFSHGPTARRVLAEAGLLEAFDAVLISDEVGIRKPRREIFAAVLGALGCAPSEVLHVGDQLESDVGGAAELGLRTAWITRRVADTAGARARYTGPAPDHVVADLAEISALTSGLTGNKTGAPSA
jgi:FMN phosphatase YigB (HAD superfamily)